jgi:hypothetical protein
MTVLNMLYIFDTGLFQDVLYAVNVLEEDAAPHIATSQTFRKIFSPYRNPPPDGSQ